MNVIEVVIRLAQQRHCDVIIIVVVVVFITHIYFIFIFFLFFSVVVVAVSWKLNHFKGVLFGPYDVRDITKLLMLFLFMFFLFLLLLLRVEDGDAVWFHYLRSRQQDALVRFLCVCFFVCLCVCFFVCLYVCFFVCLYVLLCLHTYNFLYLFFLH